VNERYEVETVAEAFLALMKRRGVDFLYVNAGTDFASLVEAYARHESSKLSFPAPIICPHENLAVGMAHGYTLVTGRAQAVMVHVSVGTANAVCGIMNAARDDIPMLFCAGRTPLFEKGRRGARNAHIHWAQEMFDQAGMVRELVKWDYELRDGLNVADVIDRALTLAQTTPQGPVYLTLPREVLAQELTGIEVTQAALAIPSTPAPDPAAVAQLARMIAGAKFPVILTAASGRAHGTVTALADFATRFGVGIVEYRPRFVCVPSSHPLHLGYDNRAALEKADLIVVLECDVPWMPAQSEPRADTRVVHVGLDPAFSDYPVRSFKCDLAITSSVAHLLPPLTAALEGLGSFEVRARTMWDAASARRDATAARVEKLASAPRITKAWMSHCLNAVKPQNAIVVSEYWVDRDLVDFEHPGTYFGTPPAGGLGWGLPAALGASQASLDQTVIAALGDGAYLFANPAACHQVAAAMKLPVLTIVCNNSYWNAVHASAVGVYPDGHASKAGKPAPLAALSPTPDFEKYVEASGGYGEKVTQPGELMDAMKRALDVVRTQRRQALLNVICE
jgi:acetolactate synthase-1/2/3 large subunit